MADVQAIAGCASLGILCRPRKRGTAQVRCSDRGTRHAAV